MRTKTQARVLEAESRRVQAQAVALSIRGLVVTRRWRAAPEVVKEEPSTRAEDLPEPEVIGRGAEGTMRPPEEVPLPEVIQGQSPLLAAKVRLNSICLLWRTTRRR